ncbi:hypothetical protein [Clostridium cellulovorans]|uniref:Uncharacterized protein n=1 Tax=Clostridium cellulovorans (strain ATCC 35296 / DSM 3052 / OCM 3 / 743B) TaxID=573061 RepID=D9SP70_CLOC7|nr:hypothetical protein [Clostridium cellulovorans]ADL52035.1 hypothetical protein Clocel_2313 [Clostridium cellulovorans 743B]
MELKIEQAKLKYNYQYKIIEDGNVINTAEINLNPSHHRLNIQ